MDYLLRPPSTLRAPRPGLAIAILVIYCVLLFLFGITYARLLYTVTVNPGYVPRSNQWYALQEDKAKAKGQRSQRFSKRFSRSSGAGAGVSAGADAGVSAGASASGRSAVNGRFTGHGYPIGAFTAPTTTGPAPGLQDFYSRDAFVCQSDGRPIWCSTCLNWKTDRAHHCREIERCVRKMDHFCPW